MKEDTQSNHETVESFMIQQREVLGTVEEERRDVGQAVQFSHSIHFLESEKSSIVDVESGQRIHDTEMRRVCDRGSREDPKHSTHVRVCE